MPSLTNARSTPGTAIVTTAETLAANIPGVPLTLPGGSPQGIIIRGMVYITTGTGVTGLIVKLRAGPNNTTTAQIGGNVPVPAGASLLQAVPFTIIDGAGPVNMNANGGYSLTVTQVGATGNGTITEVDYEVDYSVP